MESILHKQFSLPTPADYFIPTNPFIATDFLLQMGLTTVLLSYIGLATGFTFAHRPGPSFFPVNQISFPDLSMYDRWSLTFHQLRSIFGRRGCTTVLRSWIQNGNLAFFWSDSYLCCRQADAAEPVTWVATPVSYMDLQLPSCGEYLKWENVHLLLWPIILPRPTSTLVGFHIFCLCISSKKHLTQRTS